MKKHGRIAASAVLILHNDPSPPAGSGAAVCAESWAGVLHEAAAVAAALDTLEIPHRTASVRILSDVPAAVAGASEDIVFNLVEELHGASGDACLVPGICRAMGRGVTGNGTACHILTLDKWIAKAALRSHGVDTPGAVVIPLGGGADGQELPEGDLMIKPLATDASEGIDGASVVRRGERERIAEVVRRIHTAFGQPALVEQYIEGREFNVSIFEDGGELRVLPLAEIEFTGFPAGRPRIVDYAAKWVEQSFEYRNTLRRVPAANVPEDATGRLRCAAAASWRALGCQDYARVDFRLDAQGNPFVLEVNANPDISPDAGFCAALAAAGIAFPDFVAAVTGNAARRHARTLA
jgi:D-alanine-D-alanine ligase